MDVPTISLDANPRGKVGSSLLKKPSILTEGRPVSDTNLGSVSVNPKSDKENAGGGPAGLTKTPSKLRPPSAVPPPSPKPDDGSHNQRPVSSTNLDVNEPSSRPRANSASGRSSPAPPQTPSQHEKEKRPSVVASAARSLASPGPQTPAPRPSTPTLMVPPSPSPVSLTNVTMSLGSPPPAASPLPIAPDSMRVQVAVRIRPLNERENSLRDQACVLPVSTEQVRIEDIAAKLTRNLTAPAPDKPQSFTYDRVFGIDDGQQIVYDSCVKPIIDQVLRGFHGCIFCYGQTGSGKTYTMTGSPEQPGIIPTALAHIQRVVEEKKNTISFQLRASFLEIYQENLRDLLADRQGHIQLREDPKTGVFVEGITVKEVVEVMEMQELLADGLTRRTVAATKMNEDSSRSHAVFTIYIRQQQIRDDEGLTILESKIHLIDLAGSERADSTGATGQRLKEGAMINQSLSALGNVMKALVENRGHVPYRDSKLTRLLTDSLGGNSMTLMIANISPAGSSFQETLSTLRFADRAKQIENKPLINVDPKIKKIRELQAEVRALKALIQQLTQCKSCGGANEASCGKCKLAAPIAQMLLDQATLLQAEEEKGSSTDSSSEPASAPAPPPALASKKSDAAAPAAIVKSPSKPGESKPRAPSSVGESAPKAVVPPAPAGGAAEEPGANMKPIGDHPGAPNEVEKVGIGCGPHSRCVVM